MISLIFQDQYGSHKSLARKEKAEALYSNSIFSYKQSSFFCLIEGLFKNFPSNACLVIHLKGRTFGVPATQSHITIVVFKTLNITKILLFPFLYEPHGNAAYVC